jgi:SWI/SNF related-matrix-associated actin-dependent regulator of chromatin subfamily C
MTTVAFLASAVDPQVASAAAKAALNEFTKQQFHIPTHIENAHVDAVMKHKEDTGKCNPAFGLDKAGIAGYKSKEIDENAEMEVDGEPKENGEKKIFFC